jgi:hypothetical protein
VRLTEKLPGPEQTKLIAVLFGLFKHPKRDQNDGKNYTSACQKCSNLFSTPPHPPSLSHIYVWPAKRGTMARKPAGRCLSGTGATLTRGTWPPGRATPQTRNTIQWCPLQHWTDRCLTDHSETSARVCI